MLNEFLAGEFFYHTSLEVVLHESIVLLGSAFGKRLEPVGAVGYAHFHGPGLHALCHFVGYAERQGRAFFNHLAKLMVNFDREILEHLLLIENVLAKVFRGTLSRRFHFDRALLERLFYDFKTKVTHKLSCM